MHPPVTPSTTKQLTRLRCGVGVVLLAIGLPITAAWLWSGWNDVLVSRADKDGPGFSSVRFFNGRISYQHPSSRPADWTDFTSISHPYYGSTPSVFDWGEYDYNGVTSVSLAPYALLPLLMGSAVLIGPPAVTAARAWHRARMAGCRECGYSREGLASRARCPECGQLPQH